MTARWNLGMGPGLAIESFQFWHARASLCLGEDPCRTLDEQARALLVTWADQLLLVELGAAAAPADAEAHISAF
jgi:hypothetical protein